MPSEKTLSGKLLVFAMVISAFITAGASELNDLKLKAKTDKENPIGYKVGETIRFDFFLDGVKELPDEAAAKSPLKVEWTRTGDDGVKATGIEEISLEKGCSIETKLDMPGIVRIEAQLIGFDGSKFESIKRSYLEKGILFSGGAGVEPEKMQLTTNEPADFDEFWNEAKAKLATVPVKAKLTDVTPEKLKGKYRVCAVEIDCFGPRPATGWLTMPADAKEKSLPAKALFHGYNGNNFQQPKIPEHGFGDFISLEINAHGYEMTGHDEQYYKDYGNKVNGIAPGAPARASYALACADYDNPKDTYFYYMAMRVMRAFDYLKSLPEWDGKNLMAEGGSQGGLQTMWAAGLVDGLSEARPRITWGCDIGCPFDGKGPFPSRVWGIPSVPGAFYFDSALHAKRVPSTCRVEITRLGLGDYTCPPRGVLLSYYNLKGPAKANLVQGATHGYVPPMPNQTFVISK